MGMGKEKRQTDREVIFNSRSAAKDISGRNTTDYIKSNNQVHCYEKRHFMLKEIWDKMKINEPGSHRN